MPFSRAIQKRLPGAVVRYSRGLAMSVMHNVPAYGFSIVVSAAALTAASHLGHPTGLDALLFLLGAATAFAIVGALAALAFDEEEVERAPPGVLYLGAVLSLVSTSAGFGVAVLVIHDLRGWGAWYLSALCATLVYVFVLALELELASVIHKPKEEGESA